MDLDNSPSLDAKQRRYDEAYMRMALEWAKLSHCERKQVGALIVKDQMIIADGYNGTPSGFPNVCEADDGTTHWYVLHAEANAITKWPRAATARKEPPCTSPFLHAGNAPSSFTRPALSAWSMAMRTRTRVDWTF